MFPLKVSLNVPLRVFPVCTKDSVIVLPSRGSGPCQAPVNGPAEGVPAWVGVSRAGGTADVPVAVTMSGDSVSGAVAVAILVGVLEPVTVIAIVAGSLVTLLVLTAFTTSVCAPGDVGVQRSTAEYGACREVG